MLLWLRRPGQKFAALCSLVMRTDAFGSQCTLKQVEAELANTSDYEIHRLAVALPQLLVGCPAARVVGPGGVVCSESVRTTGTSCRS